MKKFYQRLKKSLRTQGRVVAVVSLMALFFAVYLANRIFIPIHPGEAGVLWSRFFGGTRTDYVYPEGIHYIFPWDEMQIYNVRVQQTAHEFDVLTVNGLKINLSISIRYFPEYKLLGVLHQKVGPNYVETVVIPEIESVLRVLIGRLSAEEVYTTDKSIIEKSVSLAVEQIAQRFINVDNVIIKRIEFPAFVAKAIEQKIEQKQLAAAHIFRVEREKIEAERKRIEAEGFKRYHEILNASLTNEILRWRDIQATLELSKSNNSKVVIIGSAKDQFQLFGDIPLDTTPQAVSPDAPVTQESSPETNESWSAYPNLNDSQPLFPNITGNSDMPEQTDLSGMSGLPDNSNSPDAEN